MKAPAAVPPPLKPGELFPKKIAWLQPVQLLRTAYHVWLSTMAQEYLDRRETLAALHGVRERQLEGPELALMPGTWIDGYIPHPDRDVWVDYVADIGDSWDATYAVANLLVDANLAVRGHGTGLNPGDVVVLGGDLIYPTPTRDGYRKRMRWPLIAAHPMGIRKPAPCLLAIPGNHDWYDGLTNFVREFCQGGPLGGWQMIQRRSYFAAKLTAGWWIWGIDIALDTRIDPPQQDYFLSVLRNTHLKEAKLHDARMRHPNGQEADLRSEALIDARKDPQWFETNDNIILCTAKPSWLDKAGYDSDAYRNLTYFVKEIVEKHDGCVRVILAGDLHHYSRYQNDYGDHLITAGGGGAFLTGTHHLPFQVPDLCTPALASIAPERKPGDEAAFKAAEFPYPNRSDSRRLTLGALLLAFRPANFPFALTIGAIYWLFVWTLMLARPNLFLDPVGELAYLPFKIAFEPAATALFVMVLAVAAAGAIVAAAANSTTPRIVTVPVGMVHGVLHLALGVAIAWLIHQSDAIRFMVDQLPAFKGKTVIFFSLCLVGLGGLIGATFIGVYFVVTNFLLGWHTNEAFAAQSLTSYRNFVRMHLRPNGELRIYPIGLRRIPHKWRFRLKREDYEPYL